MAYYSIISVTPTSHDWMADYVENANKAVAKYGGRYLARTSSVERLEGEGENAAVQVIIEWPSKDAALDFMADPDYSPYLQARTAGSDSHHFLVEGKDDNET
ncbi:DUF1330 domain-containing protein [Photobacterium aphoticum]|uniref:DUF1330 domain-containing protein n=1 Tax=Photobacterium aphoticum TaxID=754436 RepID=A0A0J1GRV2_9GAMM|nr:DUF1330 domain-containing protein [Photobacterium aphoticum]KLV02478.1 hypothetical protein ABT58_02895 [Photobacterium aphoticum]PSU56957.1 DUF1330 domain-containing protein [Photobacterium aphoticum]GHA64834.1 hypothetical protein GCM10007086_43200 [Photobacterium aphoticum]